MRRYFRHNEKRIGFSFKVNNGYPYDEANTTQDFVSFVLLFALLRAPAIFYHIRSLRERAAVTYRFALLLPTGLCYKPPYFLPLATAAAARETHHFSS
jgi:hypothetical protein